MALVLLVEDHADTADAMRLLLKHGGHEVHIAGTLADAERMAKACNYDVIFCDISLPDGRGTLLPPLIKGRCPTTRIVALSGADPKQAAEIGHVGFDDFLIKPASFEAIEKCIKH
jgi:DNA-binding NtrC family response regulator